MKKVANGPIVVWFPIESNSRTFKGAFTPNVKSVLSENLVGILGGTQC